MDEVVNVLRDILYELERINEKLDDIKDGSYNSISEICDKLGDVEDAISSLESAM